jgi:hypothetical protein
MFHLGASQQSDETNHKDSTFSLCAASQLTTAVQPVTKPLCNVCSAYFQCQGAFNAIRQCQNHDLDLATASSIIAPSRDWRRYLRNYINTSPNPTAASDGLATAQSTAALSSCDLKYGWPLNCPPGLALACKIAYTATLVI